MGKLSDILELDFGDFLIGRSLSADVYEETFQSNPQIVQSNVRDFRSDQRISRRNFLEEEAQKDQQLNEEWVMRGVRPFKPSAFTPHKLGSYIVSRRLWRALNERQDLVRAYPALANSLGSNNYIEKFGVLLHLEEIETTLRIKQYDIGRTALKRFGPFLALEVKGLAEKRPSLISGEYSILPLLLNLCMNLTNLRNLLELLNEINCYN